MSGESNFATPLFSVVIPSYNRAALLSRAIASCLAQTFADFEVVVVDDGSSDDTEAAVARFQDPRVRYIRQINAGAAVARNRGADAARGQYLAFLDSDDEFLPGKLAAFHNAFREQDAEADVTVWYSPLLFHRQANNRVRKPERGIAPGELVGDYLFIHSGMMQTSTLVIPRDFFLRVGFNQNLRNLQDLDLCLRLEAAGARFRMLNEPQVIWYDDIAEGRVSYATTPENVLAWATSQKEHLSDRAYYGFLARYLVPLAARRDPITAARFLGTAVRHGSISAGRATSLLLRGTMPATYGRLRDKLVSWRGA